MIDCGNPGGGQVAHIMRRTRADYHYDIRRIKRDEQEIVKERLVEAILKNDDRDFWSETKRMRRKSMVSSNVVNGCCTAEFLADYFANKYKALYSSVAYNYQEMSGVQQEINHLLYNSGFNTNCIITSEEIASGVKKLKPGKIDLVEIFLSIMWLTQVLNCILTLPHYLHISYAWYSNWRFVH